MLSGLTFLAGFRVTAVDAVRRQSPPMFVADGDLLSVQAGRVNIHTGQSISGAWWNGDTTAACMLSEAMLRIGKTTAGSSPAAPTI